MVRVKIDNRIRVMIENGVKVGHRTMFVVIGDKGKDKVPFLHQMLSKATIKARPTVLWCYKKELGFSSHKKKRMKQVQKKIKTGKLNINEDDPFELFVGSTDIRYCYYSETQKILGNTFGMCILQDFEALTPNLLARTIETVEGGGLIIILLRTLSSLKQLYTMAMEVHDRYRTEAHKNIVGRFNERFILSLSSCSKCLVVDDQLTVLPISSHILELNTNGSDLKESESTINSSNSELKTLREALRDTPLVSSVINCCKTVDQAKALLKFIEVISEKTLKNTVSLTAARGRGKSAALGLAVSSAIAFGYANIFVTSPSPENLKTFFEFVFKGFDALGYKEHMDYGLIRSANPEHNKALIRINVFKDNRQTIQYIQPTESSKLSQAELLVIDEAAAIPLPFVKEMLGPYLVFMASTINGYEGTGRSLSLKLLQHIRIQSSTVSSNSSLNTRELSEITLEESIRYRPGDKVEQWLTDLLCLDATNVEQVWSGTPPPKECNLYYINRDTLFCYHKASESFLQRVIALFVSSHYKNSPNDLQMLSDAPAHHLFCLLGPMKPGDNLLPDILCAIQVCLEGQLLSDSVHNGLSRGTKAAGDLIPWTVAQQFQDEEFPCLSGARVVRIATHPSYQGMGYGSRALSLLKDYYSLKIPSNIDSMVTDCQQTDSEESSNSAKEDIFTESIGPRETLPPLLMKLVERPAEKLDYIGVSFGLTLPLLKFWKRASFVPVYVRQTSNELTGEHSCVMLSALAQDDSSWLPQFWQDFRRRFVSLLSYRFRSFKTDLGLSVATNNKINLPVKWLTNEELAIHLTKYDIKRLQLYCNNLVDHHLIMDLIPTLAKLFFLGQMGNIGLTALQRAIFLGLGLQHKTVETLSTELDLPVSQLLGLYNRMMRKIMDYLNIIVEGAFEKSLGLEEKTAQNDAQPLTESMADELNKADEEMKVKQKEELRKMKSSSALKDYEIKGSEEDWNKALSSGHGNVVSVKRDRSQSQPTYTADHVEGVSKKKKKKSK